MLSNHGDSLNNGIESPFGNTSLLPWRSMPGFDHNNGLSAPRCDFQLSFDAISVASCVRMLHSLEKSTAEVLCMPKYRDPTPPLQCLCRHADRSCVSSAFFKSTGNDGLVIVGYWYLNSCVLFGIFGFLVFGWIVGGEVTCSCSMARRVWICSIRSHYSKSAYCSANNVFQQLCTTLYLAINDYGKSKWVGSLSFWHEMHHNIVMASICRSCL